MSEKFHKIIRPGRAAVVILATLVIGLAAALGVLKAADALPQAPAAIWTAMIAGAASMLSLIPLMFCREVGHIPAAAMCGMLVRLVVTAGGAVGLGLLTEMPRQVVGGWTLAWYLLMLTAEVWVIARMVGRCDARDDAKEPVAC